MNNFQDLVQQGSLHAWFYIPTAVLLGALHGLEPGHSKTMMAAFIIAIRGTIFQAVLLGLCAAFSLAPCRRRPALRKPVQRRIY